MFTPFLFGNYIKAIFVSQDRIFSTGTKIEPVDFLKQHFKQKIVCNLTTSRHSRKISQTKGGSSYGKNVKYSEV